MRALAAVGLAMMLGTTMTTAQVARTHELTWPTAPIGPLFGNPLAANSMTVNALTANPPSTRIPQPWPGPQERLEGQQLVSAILVTSLGSVAGLFAGAITGLALLDDSHGEFDAYYSAFVGSAIGTTLGAVVPAGLISDNWGRAVLGSLGGAIAGAMLGISVGEKFNGPMGVAVYGLTHGVFTVAAAR